ncbi:hypothetical protein [Wenxinia saemankumensis]|uniref:STAS domain-containing protein n=1 Tax=Wenxinia saemankumensis TaxID=1447782 RepID=A0A1M6DWF1_9RHOB|nr:hypothetical protein [Wenxinia saemankumensis]SHI77505.1 hypothetical protein SAMN05444417_1638 [Wenxinia saemankumensis]
MTQYTIPAVATARAHLLAVLDGPDRRMDLSAEDELDAAGAQLIVAALRRAETEGRPLMLRMAEGSPAGRTWSALALDRLYQPVPLPGPGRPAGAAPVADDAAAGRAGGAE